MPEFDSSVKYRGVVGFPRYLIGTDGSVWSQIPRGNTRGRLGQWWQMKCTALKSGHRHVNLRRDGAYHHRYVHRAVLEAFVGPCPAGMECRHFPDRDPANNRLENLCWGTPVENAADREVHGTKPRGESHGQRKLNDADVRRMRRRLKVKGSVNDLAREFHVSRQTVSGVLAGRTWTHLL